MEEKWSSIAEAPTYSISNYGDVHNSTTGKLMKTSLSQTGVVKVGLVIGGKQSTRCIHRLVAEAFVFGQSDAFNTPIHLDGNQQNNNAENLLWRPRWFAWKYARQFADTYNHERGPIRDVVSDRWYATVLEAAMTHGLLIKDILRSIPTMTETFPTGQTFSFR